MAATTIMNGAWTNPHLVLADLLAIFHPQLQPAHDFAFYQPLNGE